jgi:hypothetical protein
LNLGAMPFDSAHCKRTKEKPKTGDTRADSKQQGRRSFFFLRPPGLDRA